MEMIKTKNFQLAVYAKGNEGAAKIALVLPGRLDTKDYVHMRSHVDFLAERGFFAVSFDPPGTWESAGGIELYTTTNYIQSVNELIEYFGNKPTLLLGHSRGCTVAMLVGASNPFVSGIVVILATYGPPTAPAPNVPQMGFQEEYRDLPPGTAPTKEQKEFALPMNYFQDGQQYNPESVLTNYTKPKLLIYGSRDEFTSPDKVKAVYKTASEPKMIHELDSDHDYRYHPGCIEEANRVVNDFLKKFAL